MTTFLDGPAKGQTLMLKRAPDYLRVVENTAALIPTWDALDQLDDTPEPGEKLYAYERVAEPGYMHINAGRGRGGVFRSGAYKLCDPQPPEPLMRTAGAWRTWARERQRIRDAARTA